MVQYFEVFSLRRLVSILSFWLNSAGPAPQNPVRRPGAIQHMMIWNFVFDSRSLFSKNRPNGWGNWLEAAFDCRTMSATALWCCECLRPICHSDFVKKQVSVTPPPLPLPFVPSFFSVHIVQYLVFGCMAELHNYAKIYIVSIFVRITHDVFYFLVGFAEYQCLCLCRETSEGHSQFCWNLYKGELTFQWSQLKKIRCVSAN